jgi:uncharacterized phage protein (TIGR02220 family)
MDALTDARVRAGWWWADNAIFDIPMRPYDREVYLYLCRRADQSGESFPSITRIATDIGMSDRRVQLAIRALCRRNPPLLRVESHDGRTNTYVILSPGGAPSSPGGAPRSPLGVHDVHPPGAPRSPRRTTQKKDDLEHSLSKHVSTARELLEFLNQKTGRYYRPVPVNLKLITARLDSGVSAQDIRSVIAMKTRQWRGRPDMAVYLRPSTLFRASNFEQYYGQLHHAEDPHDAVEDR